jgi:hypothetical protein
MLLSSIPTKFQIPFANSATSTYVRNIPLSSADPVAASLTLGFPPATATPIAGGGTPPDVRDFNGILKLATTWQQWQAAGGQVQYDSVFSTAIDGYPTGAVLFSTVLNNYWFSTADNNVTNPDGGSSAGWLSLGPLWNDGTSVLPGAAFAKEVGTGFYRVVSGQVGLSILGTLMALFAANGITAPSFASGLGSALAQSSTWTNLFNVAGQANGLYLIFATFGTAQMAACLMGCSGASEPIILQQWTTGSGGLSFQISGSYVQGLHIFSYAESIHWSYIKIPTLLV